MDQPYFNLWFFFFSLRPSTNLTSALLLRPLQTSGMPRASIVLPNHPTDPPSPRNLLSRNRDGIPFSDTFNLHTVTLPTPTLRICDALNYPLPPSHQMLKRFQIDSEGSLWRHGFCKFAFTNETRIQVWDEYARSRGLRSMTSCSQWKNCTSFLCSKEKRQGFHVWDSHPPAPCNVSSTFLPKNILWRNGIIVFLRNNTEAFKCKEENAQESVALRLTEIKHGSRRLFFQIRLEIRGLFDGACKANRKVQPITEPENGDLKLSHPNQILTAHSSHLQQIQAIHNQFKSLTVNYKWLTANQVKITHSKFKFDVTVLGHLREWMVY